MKIALVYIFLFLLWIGSGCDTPVKTKIISVDGEKISGSMTYVVEEPPELLTPIDYLWAKFRRIATENEYEGTIIVHLIISETGKVEAPEIFRGGNKAINKEVLKLVQSAKFKPGKQRRKPVKIGYSLSLNTGK